MMLEAAGPSMRTGLVSFMQLAVTANDLETLSSVQGIEDGFYSMPLLLACSGSPDHRLLHFLHQVVLHLSRRLFRNPLVIFALMESFKRRSGAELCKSARIDSDGNTRKICLADSSCD